MKKILIVEDNVMNMDLLIQLLEEQYEVITAKDGAEGLKLAIEAKPDLILMDMKLPVMNGWETTRKIKSHDLTKHIPVIGISSHAMSSDAEKAFAIGCDDYLTKPLDDMLLYEKLEQYLAD